MNRCARPGSSAVARPGRWSDLFLQFFYGQIYCSTA